MCGKVEFVDTKSIAEESFFVLFLTRGDDIICYQSFAHYQRKVC